MSKPVVVVYGASSFTSRGLLEYLDTHPDGDQFEFVLAGRNKQRLDAANDKLNTKRKVVVVALDDEAGVKGLVDSATVIINMAGPYARLNAEALISACAHAGKHYVDLTGESAWLSGTIIPKYDYLATRTGACIVPSCGMDSVPSDITLYYALKTLQASRPDLEGFSNSLSFFKLRGTVSGGTLETLRDAARSGSRDRLGEWATALHHTPNVPSTPFRLVSSYSHPSVRTQVGSFFFMYPYNRTIIRRSQVLSHSMFNSPGVSLHGASGKSSGQSSDGPRTRSRASRAREGQQRYQSDDPEPTYAKEMQYHEAWDVGAGRIGSWFISFAVLSFLGFFLSSRLFRWIVDPFLPKAGEGATKEKLKKGWLKVTNFSQAKGDPSVEVKTVFEGEGDPGYLNTCYLIAECALSVALPPPKNTALPPLGQQGGVLTPSTAFGMVLVERLQASGKVKLSSEILPSRHGRLKAD